MGVLVLAKRHMTIRGVMVSALKPQGGYMVFVGAALNQVCLHWGNTACARRRLMYVHMRTLNRNGEKMRFILRNEATRANGVLQPCASVGDG